MKTRPKRCHCGAEPEVTPPGNERNCWMVMCTRCRHNGPSVIDPQGREFAVVGWNLGLDHHFLLGTVGEEWHYFGGRPRYEYTQPEAGTEAEPVDVSDDEPAARVVAPPQLSDTMSTEDIMNYAASKGDPDLIWLARRLADSVKSVPG